MEVQTITMDPEEARTAFLAYREQVRERHEREDEAIMRGYKALSKGIALIDIAQVIPEAGVDEENRPRLAIARAGHEFVWYQARPNSGPHFTTACDSNWGGADFYRRGAWHDVRLPRESLPHRSYETCRAMIPIVPPGLRPRFKLTNYHLLWEADWERAPKDPMLLKHCGGSLYAILAAWDLTPVEQAVLRGRL